MVRERSTGAPPDHPYVPEIMVNHMSTRVAQDVHM